MVRYRCAQKYARRVVDRLNKEINLAISNSAIKARLVDLGGLVLPLFSPEPRRRGLNRGPNRDILACESVFEHVRQFGGESPLVPTTA